MYSNRSDAALEIIKRLEGRHLNDPIVLAIPRGGVVTGAVIAASLGAELDVVLSRKLRAPGQSELALGAVSEHGDVFLNHYGKELGPQYREYLEQETRHQLAEIERRKGLFRKARPAAPLAGRSVIVVDDGIATGSTMIAALQTARLQTPQELIVAAPVGPPDRVEELRRWCDEVICPLTPRIFYAIGEFYEDFRQVDDEEAVELVRRLYESRTLSGTKTAD